MIEKFSPLMLRHNKLFKQTINQQYIVPLDLLIPNIEVLWPAEYSEIID